MASVKRLLSIAFCCVVAVSAAAQRLPDRSRTPDFEALWPLRFDLLKPRPDTVSLFIVGDIMSHRAVSKSAEEFGFGSFFKYLEDRIAGADLAIGNMEFPLAGKPYTGYPAFSGPDGYAQYLSDVGFDVFLTANNHILDKGTAGLRRTIDVLEQKGLVYTGIARDAQADTLLNPLLLHVRGLRIAIINFTYGTNTGPWDPWPKVNYMRKKDILPMLERAREADLVLVFPHWGTEYRLHHDPQQEEMARWLVENGADVVVGAHPERPEFQVGTGPHAPGGPGGGPGTAPARTRLRVSLVHQARNGGGFLFHRSSHAARLALADPCRPSGHAVHLSEDL